MCVHIEASQWLYEAGSDKLLPIYRREVWSSEVSQFVYSKPVSKWYRQDLNWGLSPETQAHLNAAPWC